MKRQFIIFALLCVGLTSQTVCHAKDNKIPVHPNSDPAVYSIQHAIGNFNEEAFKTWFCEKDTTGIMWHKWQWRIPHQTKWKGNRIEPENKTLKKLWKALDKQVPKASSTYCGEGEELRIPVGSRGDHVSVFMEGGMITRMLSFRTGTDYTTTFVLQWWEEAENVTQNLVTLHAAISHFTSWQGDEKSPEEEKNNPKLQKVTFKQLQEWGFNSTEDALNSRIEGDGTYNPDTSLIDPRWTSPYTLKSLREEEGRRFGMRQKNVSLSCRVMNIMQSSQHAWPTELAALALTLKMAADEYPSLLSPKEFKTFESQINIIKKMTDEKNRAASHTVMQALESFRAKLNRTPGLDNYPSWQIDYLNDNRWHILTHDLGNDQLLHYGAHYLSENLYYLNAVGDTYTPYHAEHYEEKLEPGIYRLSAVARAEAKHSGVFIFTKTGEGLDEKVQKVEIPGSMGIGGPLWESARRRVEQAEQRGEKPEELDILASGTNGGKGSGWFPIVIDGIEVRNGKLTYGVSNIPEFTGSHMEGHWFSACDFVLERIGDLPKE